MTSLTAVAALVLAGVAAPARAAAPDSKPEAPLPAVGASFELDAHSAGIAFTVDGAELTSEPLRGALTVEVEAGRADERRRSVEAAPSDLRLTTKAAQTHAITVQQGDAVDAGSPLRLVKPKPAKFTHVMALVLRFTVTMLDEPGRTFELETVEPVLLAASFGAFPPRNAEYELEESVPLRAVGAELGREVVLSGFDVTVDRT